MFGIKFGKFPKSVSMPKVQDVKVEDYTLQLLRQNQATLDVWQKSLEMSKVSLDKVVRV